MRQVDRVERVIEIHTDIRSPKWTEFRLNNAASVVVYSQAARLQLRFQGRVEWHGPETDVAENVWQALSTRTKSTYKGGPPGNYVMCSAEQSADSEDRREGKDVFGVLRFRANSLDWFQLVRDENRRGQFFYGLTGQLIHSQWINP